MKKCLICAKSVENGNSYHSRCLLKLFGTKDKPDLDVHYDELNELAKKSVYQRVTVPGVQSKLSLEVSRTANNTSKLTIVGLWGQFILKPPSTKWAELPANEHCTMMMAQVAGIETVPYGLIHLASGELAYITRRIDRDEKGNKFALEDMCQLTGRLTEDKYKGSHEQIAKVVKQYAANPFFDLTRLFELILFSYLSGNGDMHLKNFSLFNDPNLGWKLAPAYDILSTRLVISKQKDPEELSLTLRGKKSNFQLEHFKEFGMQIGLNVKQIQNIMEKFRASESELHKVIERSFLSTKMKTTYSEILGQRFGIFKSYS